MTYNKNDYYKTGTSTPHPCKKEQAWLRLEEKRRSGQFTARHLSAELSQAKSCSYKRGMYGQDTRVEW